MKRTPARILFTIPNFITAGSGHALWSVAQRLDRDRFAPSVCVLKRGGSLESAFATQGIPLFEQQFALPPRPYATLPLRLLQVASKFSPYHFDLWHSYHYADDYTEPLIARLSGARHWLYTKKNMGWGSRAWRLRTRLASRIAAQNTAMLARFFNTPRLRAKSQLLPPGIDSQVFKPDVLPRLNLRQSLNLPSETILIGCVAHLVAIKGHPMLLRALAALPGVHLALAGRPLDEAYTASLKSLSADLGIADRVHFLGAVGDIPAFSAEIDISVLASKGKGEGCPVALLEAMACGLPCVATDIPGSQDLIEHGASGLLVPPEDHEALAAALRMLIDSPNLRDNLGKMARRRILDHYTIEREVAAYEVLYAELLGL